MGLAKEKLVCDVCGFELSEKDDIALALDGTEAWQNAQLSRGQTPRGLFPCKYYFQCKGEMVLVKDKEEKKAAAKGHGLFGRK
jgi:hypothetical protein